MGLATPQVPARHTDRAPGYCLLPSAKAVAVSVYVHLLLPVCYGSQGFKASALAFPEIQTAPKAHLKRHLLSEAVPNLPAFASMTWSVYSSLSCFILLFLLLACPCSSLPPLPFFSVASVSLTKGMEPWVLCIASALLPSHTTALSLTCQGDWHTVLWCFYLSLSSFRERISAPPLPHPQTVSS